MRLYQTLHELPLFNWEQFGRTNDASYLIDPKSDRFVDKAIKIFNAKHGVKLFTDEQISDRYFELQDELLEMTESKFELEERAETIRELMQARVLYAEGDESQINLINYYEFMLKDDDQESKIDTVKNRMIVQKLYGIAINPKDVTVAEFIKITEIVKESAKKQQPKDYDNGTD